MLIVFRYTYWGAEIAENPPSVQYDEIMADGKGVGKWTDKIVRNTFQALLLYIPLIDTDKIRFQLRRWLSYLSNKDPRTSRTHCIHPNNSLR